MRSCRTSFYEFLPDADKVYRFLYQGGCLFFLSELPSWSIFKIFWCCLLRRTVCILTSRHLKNGKEYRLYTIQRKPWAVAIFYIKLTFLEDFQLEALRASGHTACRFVEAETLALPICTIGGQHASSYNVCFVGYSLGDAILRYMMDALAALRLETGIKEVNCWALADENTANS